MPKIATWARFPPNVRQHLLERMRDRAIRLADGPDEVHREAITKLELGKYAATGANVR